MNNAKPVRRGAQGMVQRSILLLVVSFISSGCILDSTGVFSGGTGGSDGTGGGTGGETSSMSSGMGGVGGTGGVGGQSSSTGGMGGSGGCDSGFADCDENPENGCEADLLNDPATCGGCMSPCGTVTEGLCASGLCTGPCGPVPDTGLFVCWVYGSLPVPANEYVGLAGGEADPDQGQTIQNQFLDPMCVNPTPGENFVQCDLGTPASNWDIQFRAGLHLTPATGTVVGTWDCSDTNCAGDVYVYQDGTEIGSLVSDVATGAVSTLPHFNPPGLLNVKVTVP